MSSSCEGLRASVPEGGELILMAILCLPRPVCLIPAIVKGVRTVCVLPFPPMSEPVLQRECC